MKSDARNGPFSQNINWTEYRSRSTTWAHGYAFGLTVMVLSMVLPLILLKTKKWL
jgi:Mg2+ and Co2+ transporter CorA